MIFHKQRGEERTRVAVKARLQIGAYDCDAILLNASSRGVLVAVDSPPVRGTRVKVVVGERVLLGQVRWHGADCCGIALGDPIDVPDLLDCQAPAVTFDSERRADCAG